MTRMLYLLRHAESAEKQPGQHDKDRELTTEGVRQAAQVGNFLAQQKIKLDTLFVSSAVRSVRTAEMVRDAMKFSPDKIQAEDELFDASSRTFFSFLLRLDDDLSDILCIGHNPVITYVAEYLTKAEIDTMQPAGLAIIRFKIDHWKEMKEGGGELIEYRLPDEKAY